MRLDRPIFLVMVLMGLALMARSTVALADPPPGRINGAYKVTVAGDFTGGGNVAIGGPNVNINVRVKDKQGNEMRLRARLDIIRGKFAGGGEIGGMPIVIDGRVDPPGRGNQVIREARLQINFRVIGDGRAGRLVGVRNGGGNGNGN